MATKRRQNAGKVTVASGPGWALLWPREAWQALSDEERAAVVARQQALQEKAQDHDKAKA